MRFEGYRRTSRVPNLTPLIDVVFLLLVFFMLTSHFVREETIPVDLPNAESGGRSDTEGRLEIVLGVHGIAYIGGEPIAQEALAEAIRRELADRVDRTVRVRGDRAVGLGAAVGVLDAARMAGADGVDIVTEAP